jgi:hypothetical protein
MNYLNPPQSPFAKGEDNEHLLMLAIDLNIPLFRKERLGEI